MKLFLCVLFSVVVVRGVPIGKETWLPQDLLPVRDFPVTDVQNLLPRLLSSVNVDYATPISTVDPTIVWRAMQLSARSVLDTTMPAQCKETAMIHLIAGFVRHLTKRVVTEDIRSAIKEIREIQRIKNFASQSFAPIELQTIPIGKGFGASAIEEIQGLFSTELLRKFFDPSVKLDAVRMEGLFHETHSIIERSIVLDKPIGHTLSELMATISKYIGYLSSMDCRAFPISFLPMESTPMAFQEFLQSTLAKLSLEQSVKEIVEQRLSRTLPQVASVIGNTLVEVKNGKLDVLLPLLFKKHAEQMNKFIAIRQMVNRIFNAERTSTLVDWKLPQPLTKLPVPEEITKFLIDPLVAIIGDVAVTPMEAEKMVRDALEMLTMNVGGNALPGYPTYGPKHLYF